MREVNLLGVTDVIDAGGGFQTYPEDYRIIEELHAEGDLSVRITYNLFTDQCDQLRGGFGGSNMRDASTPKPHAAAAPTNGATYASA
jgi:predicted amidohydrolase YtcJ